MKSSNKYEVLNKLFSEILIIVFAIILDIIFLLLFFT